MVRRIGTPWVKNVGGSVPPRSLLGLTSRSSVLARNKPIELREVDPGEPILRWGKEAQWSDPPRYQLQGYGVQLKDGKEEDKWYEIHRETDKIKVENPEDPQDYVWVERIRSITYYNPVHGQKRTVFYKYPDGQ